MVSYVVYHVIQTPFLFIPTHKLQYIFILKSMLVPPMALATVIWISVKAGGGDAIFKQPPTVHGSERAWLWLMNMTSITGKQISNLLLEYRLTLLRWLFDTGGQHFRLLPL
jgi:NCS1 family nucleobase:cation symporter-1